MKPLILVAVLAWVALPARAQVVPDRNTSGAPRDREHRMALR